MKSGPRPALQPHPQRDSKASKGGGYKVEQQQMSTHRHSAGSNGARPKRGTRRECGTLVLEQSEEDTAAAGHLGSGYNP